ncbi:MAG: TetR/AcrR family transcriptional regulator [Thermodesulfobacteriota bacterium]|nr:TetR/AcrR family transcriptional regulator [Thermodesulfobacteriota bacterium]
MSKKQAIIEAATRLFSQKGFENTSMSELAKLSGIAQGTIFYHFKNKEELFISILEEFKAGIIDNFDRYIGERQFESGMEMIEDVVSFYLYLAGSMEDWFILLYRHEAYEFARVNSVCRESLEAIYNCLADIFEQAILRGKKDGSIADVPVRKTALILFAMIDGIIRFNLYELYNAGTLYKDVIGACRKILTK